MNRECYTSGQCVKCGCATTALQMCDRACEGNCYPPMLDSQQWKQFKAGNTIIYQEGNLQYLWKLQRLTGKPLLTIVSGVFNPNNKSSL